LINYIKISIREIGTLWLVWLISDFGRGLQGCVTRTLKIDVDLITNYISLPDIFGIINSVSDLESFLFVALCGP
jgi:hypothetical protein